MSLQFEPALKKIICILGLWSLAVNYSYSQGHKVVFDHEVFPFAGLDFGKCSFVDIGVCYTGSTIDLPELFSFNLFIANEFKLNKDFIIGPKIGGWVTYKYFLTGLNFIDYTDFKTNAIVFRPEIGIEYRRFKLAYGYNFKLSSSSLNFNSNQCGVAYTFRRNIYSGRRLKKYEKD